MCFITYEFFFLFIYKLNFKNEMKSVKLHESDAMMAKIASLNNFLLEIYFWVRVQQVTRSSLNYYEF